MRARRAGARHGAARARRASTSARGTTFADLGQTIAEIFGVGRSTHGTSFLREILR